MQVPNALYLGVPRCASTWLWSHLRQHPDVFVPPVKDIYFFDRYYDRGLDWYLSFFDDARDESIRIEFSHDYVFAPAAPRRVADDLGQPRLVLGLREPVSYLRSTLANSLRHAPGASEMAAMTESGRLVGSAQFDRFLAPWLDVFDRSAFCVYRYDEVEDDPSAVYGRVLEHLGLPEHPTTDLDRVVNESAAPRSRMVAAAAKRGARLARRAGAEPLLGKVKGNSHVRRLIYRVDADPPAIDFDDEALHGFFRPTVHRLSEQLDIDLVDAWGYA